jgi:hypothetical protein
MRQQRGLGHLRQRGTGLSSGEAPLMPLDLFPSPPACSTTGWVVLQKLSGGWGADGELLLCGQPEHLLDDTILCEDIPLGEPIELAFVEHMHRFIALDSALCRGERSKPQPRIHTAF